MIRTYLLADVHSSRLAKILRILFWIGAGSSLLWGLYFIYRTIVMPYPIEYREGAASVMTQILLMGGNPFSSEFQPLGMNNYGITYSLFVTPLAALFGNTLLIHRAVTFLFLALIFLLTNKIIRADNKDPLIALMFCVIILAALSGRGGSGAFPSMMGVFILLLAVLIPFRFAFSYPVLFLSALLCVFAYYTKPYFLLSVGIVASYVFLFISKKKGMIFTFLFLFIFVCVYVPVRYFFDFYFIDTFLGNMVNARRSFAHLGYQLRVLAGEFFPTLIATFLILFLHTRGASLVRERSFHFDIRSLEKPLISWTPDYFAYFFFCSTLAFVFMLGPHIGATNYAYQIMIPPFYLWLSRQITPRSRIHYISTALILFNLILLAMKIFNPEYLSQNESNEWARLYKYVRGSTHILNSPVIASVMVEQGMLPVDSGQTEYFYRFDGDPYQRNIFLGPEYRVVKNEGRLYKEIIQHSVINKEYDLIVISDGQWLVGYIYTDLPTMYTHVDTIALDMPQTGETLTVQIWMPIAR